MEHYMDHASVAAFERMLIEDEKCRSTRKKYVRDVNALLSYLGGPGCVTKASVIAYKQHLTGRYAVATVNGKLASINSFFKKMSWYDCVVKTLRVQQSAFRPPERKLTKAEYYRLLRTAKAQGNERLYLMMQTLCSTGIRIGELPFIRRLPGGFRMLRQRSRSSRRRVILSWNNLQKASLSGGAFAVFIKS